MNGADPKKLHLACQIVWALDIGIAVTLVLTILRAAQFAPGLTDFLLRLGWYLLPSANSDKVRADTVFVLISAVAYGLLAFAAIQLWKNRRARGSRQTPHAERRRAFRVALATPVFLYGWSRDEPFVENTETLNVSEVGGLIPISARVAQSQELILTNLRTDKDIPCRIARLTKRANGELLAGLDFLQGSPDFWEIEFVSAAAAATPQISVAKGGLAPGELG